MSHDDDKLSHIAYAEVFCHFSFGDFILQVELNAFQIFNAPAFDNIQNTFLWPNRGSMTVILICPFLVTASTATSLGNDQDGFAYVQKKSRKQNAES